MTESAIERYLRLDIKKHGGQCYKWISPGCTGVPDRIVIAPGGRVVFVELKADSGRLSARQKQVAAELRQAGADVRVIRGLDEAIAFLREVFPD